MVLLNVLTGIGVLQSGYF